MPATAPPGAQRIPLVRQRVNMPRSVRVNAARSEEQAMSEEVVFYSSPMSRGRVVHWMLEEAQAPYRYEMVNLDTGDQKKPAYLAVNPMGKVPTIVHRGTVVTECGAICAYLADAFPAAGLAPALDSPLRGSY